MLKCVFPFIRNKRKSILQNSKSKKSKSVSIENSSENDSVEKTNQQTETNKLKNKNLNGFKCALDNKKDHHNKDDYNRKDECPLGHPAIVIKAEEGIYRCKNCQKFSEDSEDFLYCEECKFYRCRRCSSAIRNMENRSSYSVKSVKPGERLLVEVESEKSCSLHKSSLWASKSGNYKVSRKKGLFGKMLKQIKGKISKKVFTNFRDNLNVEERF
ncbi:hypothetical protein MHBO_000293 [Bonamia ostreae]|uniref:Uncharacterized protein n=1 Tax=Bonamia ostreae TaxID=126728 RepID=A0ABV2AF35_9EUKA